MFELDKDSISVKDGLSLALIVRRELQPLLLTRCVFSTFGSGSQLHRPLAANKVKPFKGSRIKPFFGRDNHWEPKKGLHNDIE